MHFCFFNDTLHGQAAADFEEADLESSQILMQGYLLVHCCHSISLRPKVDELSNLFHQEWFYVSLLVSGIGGDLIVV